MYLDPRDAIFFSERALNPHAYVCRHRYRIELLQVEDCQGCGAPVEDAGRGPRGDAAGRERLRVGAGVSGGDGADAAGAEAVSAGGAGARGGPDSRGGHVGHARCAQRRGVSGVGEGGDGLDDGDHLRAGRRPADSPGRDGRGAGRGRKSAADRPGRRQLRDHALRAQADQGDDQRAAGRGAADGGVSVGGSGAGRRTGADAAVDCARAAAGAHARFSRGRWRW